MLTIVAKQKIILYPVNSHRLDIVSLLYELERGILWIKERLRI